MSAAPEAREDRLDAVIAASPIPILEVGLDDRVRLWNPAAERVFGWSAGEVVGEVVPFVPPEARGEFVELVARVRSGTTYTGFEAVRLRKDGTRIDVEISAAPIREPDGSVSGHMVAFVDITERKGQEAELQRLNAELRAGVDELRASRARIVEAADSERRRLERNLHDGAQQRLVTLALDLRLARGRVSSDPDEACRLLDTAAGQLAEALAELRELARGIHPAVLSDRGLVPALEVLANRAPLPVAVVSELGARLPAAVEAAAYYVVSEALANVAKYARATSVQVRVARDDGRATVEIFDDGIGGADARNGSGLRGLADRVEALHGRLAVESPQGCGTRLLAEIPRV
jgi:PAS domain S-box-containing protein